MSFQPVAFSKEHHKLYRVSGKYVQERDIDSYDSPWLTKDDSHYYGVAFAEVNSSIYTLGWYNGHYKIYVQQKMGGDYQTLGVSVDNDHFFTVPSLGLYRIPDNRQVFEYFKGDAATGSWETQRKSYSGEKFFAATQNADFMVVREGHYIDFYTPDLGTSLVEVFNCQGYETVGGSNFQIDGGLAYWITRDNDLVYLPLLLCHQLKKRNQQIFRPVPLAHDVETYSVDNDYVYIKAPTDADGEIRILRAKLDRKLPERLSDRELISYLDGMTDPSSGKIDIPTFEDADYKRVEWYPIEVSGFNPHRVAQMIAHDNYVAVNYGGGGWDLIKVDSSNVGRLTNIM